MKKLVGSHVFRAYCTGDFWVIGGSSSMSYEPIGICVSYFVPFYFVAESSQGLWILVCV